MPPSVRPASYFFGMIYDIFDAFTTTMENGRLTRIFTTLLATPSEFSSLALDMISTNNLTSSAALTRTVASPLGEVVFLFATLHDSEFD